MKKMLILLIIAGLLQTCNLNKAQQTKSQMGQACWPIRELQPGAAIPGSLVYSDDTNDGPTYIVVDLSTFQQKEIDVNDAEGEGYLTLLNPGMLTVVYDRKVQLISETETQSILIPETSTDLRAMYQPLNEYPRSGGQIVLSDWAAYSDDGQGLLDAARNQYQFLVVNPGNSEISTLDLYLPGVDYQARTLPPIHFSPDLNYVLYRMRNSETYAIYDLKEKSNVLQIPPMDSQLLIGGTEPHWLPDTNMISAELNNPETNQRDYYFIDLAGGLTQETHLRESVNATSSLIRNPAQDWSPDLKYLMLADTKLHLFVWDQESSVLVDPCLLASAFLVDQPNPIWLANGDYVYLNLRYVPEDPGHSPIDLKDYRQGRYLLDLINKIIYEIPNTFDDGSSGNPFGWVNWEVEE